MSLIAREFAMKDLGNLSYFLGINVSRNSEGLFLNQTKYASEIIERADLVNCNPVKTPVDTNGKLSSSKGKPYSNATLLRSLAGALQYLTFTRPDISYAVQQIGVAAPIHADPHPATVFLGDNLISWSSKRQPTVSRSSAEAEYRGVANVVSESCWICNLLLELHVSFSKATLVFCDNVSAIILIRKSYSTSTHQTY
ncbi:uncharacterized mitochondrial protein AtMg00810-like [Rutidosis leptorrhynchoides]|uniref:uncharacterized mitochondrial protein AtMg00810-like n=1 Tax=Rutidosis leptorrhynchoides TaxID=125765 RepID=UPI003A9A4C76